ncbi:MAG: magnesium transporter CorA family protein [Caulobacteraceae bacterium]|nr:magnesium transporter CorA family protein [Caulobacteraceae bacterium]
MLFYHPHGAAGDSAPAAETVWIDLLDPTEAEIRLIEDHCGHRVPTLQDLSEIERTSQLIVDGQVLRLSTPVIAKADTAEPELSYLGMILTPELLVTVRFEKLKVFEDAAERACPQGRESSSMAAFVVLMEAVVDRQADLLERVRGKLDEISRRVFRAPSNGAGPGKTPREKDVLRRHLRALGDSGERVSMIRDSLLGVGRIAPFVQENAKDWISPEHATRLHAVSLDIESLNQFEGHLSGKVQFLLDAVLGFINIEQNDLFKVLTIASVVGIPPTLVASMYGMNFHDMPELGWKYGYPYGLGVIALATILPILWFKWRRWL